MKTAVFTLFFSLGTLSAFALENEEVGGFSVIPMAGYNYIGLDNGTLHIPGVGFALTKGDYGKDFTEIHRSFFGVASYQPVFVEKAGAKESYHQIDALLEGRVERHELLGIFRSASDKPVAGGLHTYQAALGYGYEVIRKPSVSLILGAAVLVGDFGLSSSVIPWPMVRLALDFEGLEGTFDFLTGPNISFTILPKKRIRFTADMRMDYYRGIEDVLCEYILWYRFFDINSEVGDFMGVGIGFKNDSLAFDLSAGREEKIELQYSAVFGVIDFTALKLEGGFIFDSRYLVNERKTGSQGEGVYLAVQGMYRF